MTATVGLSVGNCYLQGFTTDPAAKTRNPDLDPEPALVKLIQSAQASLLVSCYALTLQPVADAIIARRNAGVIVRVVMDATEYQASTSLGPQLLQAGIDIRVWGGSYKLNHEKVVVADHAACWAGSYNFTNQAEKSNEEIANLVTGAAVVKVWAPIVEAQIQDAYAAGSIPGVPTARV